jgi:transcriptional regulator with XRE-family HTH domain
MNLILAVMPCHVAKTLRVLRQECGLSQGKLEEMTPFSKSTISLREGRRNRNYPTTTTLSIYCEAYGIKLTEFVSRLFLVVEAEEARSFPLPLVLAYSSGSMNT